MKNKLCIIGLGICILTLSACSTVDGYQNDYMHYTSYQPYGVHYGTTQFYPPSYEGGVNYYDSSQSASTANVPDSYYAGSTHSPVSHKDIDRQWVSNQNPQSYTIEMADSEKPSQVAGKLYKAPKTDRRAQVKYYRDGRSYYKGVYGSYNSYEEAQKALQSLPEEVKQGAGIKNWGQIQSSVGN